MWATAAVLACVGMALPHPEGASMLAFGALAATSGVIAAVIWAGARRIGRPAMHFAAAASCVAACVAVALDGEPSTGTQIMLLWPTLYAAYFFEGRAVVAHLALICLSYVIVTALDGFPDLAFIRLSNTCGAIVGIGIVVAMLRRRLVDVMRELSDAAVTDALTGILNRRGFERELQRALARAGEQGECLSLIIGDLDHFKTVNDLYGHEVGDRVLKATARALIRSTRVDDVIARIGGEEFAVVMPATSLADGHAVAERLRSAVASSVDPAAGRVSISVGIAMHPSAGVEAAELLRAADRALYGAKQNGRDQVLVAA